MSRPRDSRPGISGLRVVAVGCLLALVGSPLAYSELTVFNAGLVAIFLVATLGLHILVNWAGELSLAHAGVVGLPAFVVVAVSEAHGISPIYLLPVAVVVGAGTGAIVGLPAMRSRGLEVALVTLAAGITLDRFFFTKTWLVGSAGGRKSAPLTLAGLDLATSRDRYPLLIAITAAALIAAWALMHSKVARAWYVVRASPEMAASLGIRSASYRVLAYAISGGFAGLAGGMFVMWVERLSGASFPTGLSVTYLVMAVLAGRGYAGGVAVAAVGFQGGQLLLPVGLGEALTYVAPVALVFNVTRYPDGFNGLGRAVVRRAKAHIGRVDPPREGPSVTGPRERAAARSGDRLET